METCTTCGKQKKEVLLLNTTVYDCVNPDCGKAPAIEIEGNALSLTNEIKFPPAYLSKRDQRRSWNTRLGTPPKVPLPLGILLYGLQLPIHARNTHSGEEWVVVSRSNSLIGSLIGTVYTLRRDISNSICSVPETSTDWEII